MLVVTIDRCMTPGRLSADGVFAGRSWAGTALDSPSCAEAFPGSVEL
jgi:hypothetical protein